MRTQSSAKVAGASSSRGRITPCCSKVGLKRGPWTPDEDKLLTEYINKEGEGRWRTLPKKAGLLRCGKSCRLRWMNYLRPSVKRGHITPDEEDLILRLHRLLGNRWSLIAGRIPGRTDNEIKNYWNTHLSKKLISQGIDPKTHKPLINPSNDNKSHTSAPITFPVPTTDEEKTVNGSSSVNVGGTDQIEEQLHLQHNSGGGTNQIEEQLQLNMDAGGISIGDEDIEMDFCTDEVFLSFFDSLMNDDMFTAAAQNNQQSNDNIVPSSSEHYQPSNPFDQMGFPFSTAGWDDDFLP